MSAGGDEMAGQRAKATEAPTMLVMRDRVRAAGLRSTAPRLAVYRRLWAAQSPVSHAELTTALAEEGFDRATIYRNLNDLAEAGLVTRTDLGDHVWRFELKREGAHAAGEHPHFTCNDCGTVECLPDVKVAVTGGTKKSPRIAFDEVYLKGTCSDCVQ